MSILRLLLASFRRLDAGATAGLRSMRGGSARSRRRPRVSGIVRHGVRTAQSGQLSRRYQPAPSLALDVARRLLQRPARASYTQRADDRAREPDGQREAKRCRASRRAAHWERWLSRRPVGRLAESARRTARSCGAQSERRWSLAGPRWIACVSRLADIASSPCAGGGDTVGIQTERADHSAPGARRSTRVGTAAKDVSASTCREATSGDVKLAATSRNPRRREADLFRLARKILWASIQRAPEWRPAVVRPPVGLAAGRCAVSR